MEAGTRLGPYVLEERLGRGGMATVYRALDTKLQRRVALKILHPDMAFSERLRQRFLREAQAAARLKHPHIVEVHGAEEIDGRLLLIMEYIEGTPLDRVRLERRAGVALVRRLAEAVDHAHRHGVVHRDLKPANVILDAAGEPHVVDFGLAHLSDTTQLTRTGSQLGTPMYMSPEQVAGRPDQIDKRTDVYGLGAILYEILAGRPPHIGTSLPDIYARILNEDPPAPPVERDLAIICMKALAKEPGRRYASAAGLAADLHRWLEGESIEARPASVFYVWRRRLARHKAVVAAVLAAFAGAAALAAVGLPRLREAERREAATRALGAAWNRIIFAKTELYRGQIDPAKGRAELRAAIEAVKPDSPQSYYVRARGRFYLGDRKGAEADLLRATELEPAFDPGWALLGRVHMENFRRASYGPVWSVPGKEIFIHLDKATEALKKVRSRHGWVERWGLLRTREDDVAEVIALALMKSRIDADDPAGVAILKEAMKEYQSEEYCVLLGSSGLPLAEREEWLNKAIALMPGYDRAWLNRGMVRGERGDKQGAIADFTECLRLDPDDALAYASRGAERENTGDFEGALADCTKALELDPSLTWVWFNRGVALVNLKRHRDAIPDFDRAIEVDPNYRNAWYCRGSAKVAVRDYEGALADFTRTVEIDPKDAEAWFQIGLIHYGRREFAEAVGHLDKAIALNPKNSFYFLKRGMAHGRLGDEESAARDFSKVIEIDPKNAEAYYNRGVSYGALGRQDEALADYSKAIELDPADYKAFANRGMIRFVRNDWKAAAADFESALKHGPEGWPSRAKVEGLLREAREK